MSDRQQREHPEHEDELRDLTPQAVIADRQDRRRRRHGLTMGLLVLCASVATTTGIVEQVKQVKGDHVAASGSDISPWTTTHGDLRR